MMIVKPGSPYQRMVLKRAEAWNKGARSKVFINQEMTKAERKQEFELRRELKGRRDAGEKKGYKEKKL